MLEQGFGPMSVHPWMDVAGSTDSVVQELRGDGAMGELKIEQKRQSRRPRRAVEPQDLKAWY